MERKLLTILVATLLVFSMCITSSAKSEQYIYEFDSYTVIFDEDTTLSTPKMMAIAENLENDNGNTSTYGLWCTLFGHSYESHTATKITHCVYDTNPRCLKEIYEVQVCSRCEDTVSNLIGSSYITCCPEE